MVPLIYPSSWTVAISPYANEAERRAQGWLRENRVIHDSATEEKFVKLSVAEYANWPFPFAVLEKAEIITKFLSLWIFYDDIIEEDDDRLGDSIRRAIAGRLKHVRIDNPHLRCWAELGRRYSEVMSRAWLDRHARRFIAWVYSVREESEAAKVFRQTGFYPPAAKHLERRRMNIGMIPNIDFIEYQMGWELPARFLKDPNFKKLERLSAEVVAIINDLFGFTKDQRNRWSNLVPCVAQEFEISLEEAFRCVSVMHNHRIYQMVNCEEKLLEKFPNHPMLRRWLDGLHHIVYGFARWHAMAPRYSHRHPVETGKRDVRIVIQEKINPSQKISNRLAS